MPCVPGNLEQLRTLARLLRALPKARRWIGDTLLEHRSQRVRVSDAGFERLRDYFPAEFVDTSYAVTVPQCPRLPLRDWGLTELDEASPDRVSGITFLDTFFVRAGREGDESLYFHELVHVAQWRRLGFFRFALLYGLGLAQAGYRMSPLEQTAYDLQAAFDAGESFDALARTHAATDALATRFRAAGPLPRAVWALGRLVPPPRTG